MQIELERAKLRKVWLKSSADGLHAELQPYLSNSEYMEGVKVAGLVLAHASIPPPVQHFIQLLSRGLLSTCRSDVQDVGNRRLRNLIRCKATGSHLAAAVLSPCHFAQAKPHATAYVPREVFQRRYNISFLLQYYKHPGQIK